MKLKNGELIELYDTIKTIDDVEKNRKMFTHAITLTELNIQSNVIALLKIGQPSVEYIEYEKHRGLLLNKYADRDSSGKVIINSVTNLAKIKNDNMEDAKLEFDKVDKEYEDILESRNKELNEYYSILDKEVDVDIVQCKFEYFPEYLSKKEMRSLRFIEQRED